MSEFISAKWLAALLEIVRAAHATPVIALTAIAPYKTAADSKHHLRFHPRQLKPTLAHYLAALRSKYPTTLDHS